MRKKGRKTYTRKRANNIPVAEMLPTIQAFFKIAVIVGAIIKAVKSEEEKPTIDNIQDAEAEVISTEIKK